MKTPKIDIVITRHAPLVALLRERGLIDEWTPVIEHATISDVAGKHVLGVLPHWLSSKAASVTEIPMHGLTQEDREAMTKGDLGLTRTREVAGEAVTYYVTTERPWPVMRVFDRAVRAATAWSTFHVNAIGPGLLRLEAAEGTDWAEVDLYKDRYRTACGRDWSPWLDENGERHENQSAPAGEYVYKLEKAPTYRLEGRDGFELPKDEHVMLMLCTNLSGADALCTLHDGNPDYIEIDGDCYTLTLWLGVGEAWRARLDSVLTGRDDDDEGVLTETWDVPNEDVLGRLLVRAMGHSVDVDPMGWLRGRAEMGVARG